MKEKKNFQIPTAILIEFGVEDIILTSGDGPNNAQDPDLDWNA